MTGVLSLPYDQVLAANDSYYCMMIGTDHNDVLSYCQAGKKARGVGSTPVRKPWGSTSACWVAASDLPVTDRCGDTLETTLIAVATVDV